MGLLNLDDPQNQMLLNAGLAMMMASGASPVKRSLGEIIGAGGISGMNAYNARKRAMLLENEDRRREEEQQQSRLLSEAKIQELLASAELRKMRAAQGVDVDAPANIREWQEFNRLSPEDQKRYLEMKRQMYQVSDIGGVPSLVGRSPGMNTQPLSSLQQEMSGQSAIAGARQRAIEQQRANYDLVPNYDRGTGQIRLTPRGELIGGGIPQSDVQRLPPQLHEAVQGVQVPGGTLAPEQQKIDKEAEAKRKSAETSLAVAENTIRQIDKALGQVGFFTTGIPGAVAGRVPGTSAYNLKSTVTTVKSNLGFDRLQAMRDASPTGGALGQVAIQELEALQASIANLDTSQTDAQLIENLKTVKQHYENWRKTLQRAAGTQEQSAPRLRFNPKTGDFE